MGIRRTHSRLKPPGPHGGLIDVNNHIAIWKIRIQVLRTIFHSNYWSLKTVSLFNATVSSNEYENISHLRIEVHILLALGNGKTRVTWKYCEARQILIKSWQNQCQFFCLVSTGIHRKIFAKVFLCFIACECNGGVNIWNYCHSI